MTLDKRHIILKFAEDNGDVPELQFINADPDGVVIKEIGEIGMVNYIFRVQSRDGRHSVILKYGESTMKAASGEEISLDRQSREYAAMSVMQSAVPGNTVLPYCFDTKHHIIAMEDLSDWKLLGSDLKEGNFDQNVAMEMGKLLARLHRRTSKERVDPNKWQEWKTHFAEKDYINGLLDYILRMFIENDPLNNITDEVRPIFHKCAQEVNKCGLKEKICALVPRDECFIHADCHFNAIFVKGNDIKLFDYEFVILGHGGFNVSYLVMSYIVCAYDAAKKTGLNGKEVHRQAEQALRTFVGSYFEERDDLQEKEARQQYLKDIAFFCGTNVFLFVNLTGLERVLTLTAADRIRIMEIGLNFMQHYEDITTIDQLARAAFPDNS